ncbi:MAG: helix-turn-helix domain-containing protein [Salibacteraceae bacterium]
MNRDAVPIHDFSRDDDSSIPFKLEVVEHQNHYNTTEAHRHNYYEIFLFAGGGGRHVIDFKSFNIADQSVHFLSPGQIHEVERSPGSHGWVIKFSRDFFYLNLENKNVLFDLPFLHNQTSNPTLALKDKEFEEIKSLFTSIDREYDANSEFKADILRSYLNILLLKCNSLFETLGANQVADDKASGKVVHRFRKLVEENFTQKHQVGEYAEMLSVSAGYLNDATKKVFHKNASQLIQDRIILEVKRLLMHSTLNNKEIAYFLNFNDPSYFSRFVKKQTGLSPNALRDKIQDSFRV